MAKPRERERATLSGFLRKTENPWRPHSGVNSETFLRRCENDTVGGKLSVFGAEVSAFSYLSYGQCVRGFAVGPLESAESEQVGCRLSQRHPNPVVLTKSELFVTNQVNQMCGAPFLIESDEAVSGKRKSAIYQTE